MDDLQSLNFWVHTAWRKAKLDRDVKRRLASSRQFGNARLWSSPIKKKKKKKKCMRHDIMRPVQCCARIVSPPVCVPGIKTSSPTVSPAAQELLVGTRWLAR